MPRTPGMSGPRVHSAKGSDETYGKLFAAIHGRPARKSADGVESGLTHAPHQAGLKRFLAEGAVLADQVGLVEREGTRVPPRFGMVGRGKLALPRGQPFVAGFTAFDIGVVLAAPEAADPQVKESVAQRVDQDPTLAAALDVEEAGLVQAELLTAARQAAESVQLSGVQRGVIRVFRGDVALEFFRRGDLAGELLRVVWPNRSTSTTFLPSPVSIVTVTT